MRMKDSPPHLRVKMRFISTQALFALFTAELLSRDRNHGELVITSVNDCPSVHARKSRHHRGDAVDFKIPSIIEDYRAMHDFRDDLDARLGEDFDVVLHEIPGPPTKYVIHVEYDPREP